MDEKAHEISYGCVGEALFVQFTGEGTRDTCKAADRLVTDFLAAHSRSPSIVFDLRACGWVDSTFAGWMVGLNKRLKKADGDGGLRVVGWSDECRDSLARMNLCRLFEHRDADQPEHIRVLDYPGNEPPDRAAIELMAGAHRELAELNDENRRVFGPIADMLEQQLRQLPS